MSIEIIDFLEPGERGGRCPALMDDNLSREAGVVPRAFADYPELLRQELCAELTTLNHYGLGDVGCALVDGSSRSRFDQGARPIGGLVTD
jgi:hypothetical protein